MYIYDDIDQRMVDERVAQFRDQTRRFLEGQLAEDDFRQLRLRNGLYVAALCADAAHRDSVRPVFKQQLRKLADIARRFDRGYGHFSTRQNLQLNWPKLEDVPEILAELATVQMHAIQTSGNCVRNITTDHFAGVAQDEIVDSFVWCELIRQWSHASTRSSTTCRASSRSRSTAPSPTARPPSFTTSAFMRVSERTAKSDSRSSSAAASAARR